MEAISVNFTTNRLEIAAACALLLVFGLAYAALVRHLRRRDPDHGYTPWLVVVGDAAIVVGFTTVTNLALGALLLTLMASAGMPMIWEYIDSRAIEKEGKRAVLRIEQLEDTHGLSTKKGGLHLRAANHRR